MLNVKPDLWVEIGAPPFKTQKLLGGRALVTDTFDKDVISTKIPAPVGAAYYAHRDGYNVLYGDWHMKWYGDPQQRIMWWPISSWPFGALANNVISDYYNPLYGTGAFVRRNATTMVWHIFDTDAGVDVMPPE
jgi:hypothetical protein